MLVSSFTNQNQDIITAFARVVFVDLGIKGRAHLSLLLKLRVLLGAPSNNAGAPSNYL